MAKKAVPTTVVVYGTRRDETGAVWAERLPQQVRDQLWLAHRLREDLVEIHDEHEAAKAAIWSSYPDIAVVEAQIEELDTHRRELAEQAGKDRSVARSRRAETA